MYIEVSPHDDRYAIGLRQHRFQYGKNLPYLVIPRSGSFPSQNFFFRLVRGNQAHIGQIMQPSVEDAHRSAIHINLHSAKVKSTDAIGECILFNNGITAVDT